jgi:Zn-dependent peptidase ImmA (M78 family)
MSLLIERFAGTRDGKRPGLAEQEIIECVKTLRRRIGLRAVAPSRLEPFLTLRKIWDVTTANDLKADGALVPLGSDFSAGFRMVLRRDLPETRINFTVAHEICHTFFYERAPEIKFTDHPVDPEEERLCNCGAEEMLTPAFDVKRRTKGKPVSLDVLQTMAAHYRVSMSAMLIRLRRLNLWKAELVLWHEMTNGTFAVKRLWGGRLVDWQWMDSEIPRNLLAASAEKIISGHTFWVFQTPKGRKFRPVSYQIMRQGNDVLALIVQKQEKSSTLLQPDQSDLFSRPAPHPTAGAKSIRVPR